MKRLVPSAAAVLLVLGAGMPAHAGSRSGSVILPANSPAAVKVLHNVGVDTNLIGVVFRVGPEADGLTYTMTKTSGLGNLDAYFYTDDDGDIGQLCGTVPREGGIEADQATETGRICPESHLTVGWAMVVLRWGFNAGFTIVW